MRRTLAAPILALALAATPVLTVAAPAAAAPPTATVVVAEPILAIGSTSTVTITFSEPVTGFDTGDLVADGGTISNLATSDNVTYTALLTPASGVEVGNGAVVVANHGVVDGSGVPGTGTSTSNAYWVDTLRPVAAITLSRTSLRAGDTATVTVTFSEAVTGFTAADLTVAGGTVNGLSSSDGGLSWTATLTPTAGITATGQVITLANGAVADLAGNTGAGTTTSAAYSVDTQRPTASIASSVATVRTGETATVVAVFSEPVSAPTGPGLAATSGTLTPATSADGGLTWTSTFTPDPGVRGTAALTLDLSTVTDAAGNVGSGTAIGPVLDVRTVPLTATVDVSGPRLTTTTTARLTVTFSEPVSSGVPAALRTPGATLGGLGSADGGLTWTGTLTGAAGTESGPAAVTLDLAALRSADGNAGSGTASSTAYTVDTVAPTATLALATDRVTGPTTLTITFSEPVTRLALTDLVADAGVLSDLATADGGSTWTATYTPDAGARAGTATIRLDLPGVTDLAGNPGASAALSAPFAVAAPAAVPGAEEPGAGGPGTGTPGAVAPGAVTPGAVTPGAVPATGDGVPAGTRAADPADDRAEAAQLASTGSGVALPLAAAAALLLAGSAAIRLRPRLRRARA
ncbi:Ig-like domain-containing protein [Cellulomonas sp. ACRRI]|uniref:Ig-like domain-containing protein n=1 Tax=Cellulomonas sp. ACRRI TaxID=2918188 RepID=UPI001EF22960|nr:Ig-like domain-containing protein [Cellulomonas sp. ACRRI]MCG7286515.1 Ig-like domain-containing protein [Cellulomonas sp. ACRRI]